MLKQKIVSLTLYLQTELKEKENFPIFEVLKFKKLNAL